MVDGANLKKKEGEEGECGGGFGETVGRYKGRRG